MGQLRTSLTNVAKIVKGLSGGADKAIGKLDALKEDVSSWRDSGFKGQDEMFVYVTEKLRKQGVDFKTVRDHTLKQYNDSQIQQYLAAFKMFMDMGAKISQEFTTLKTDIASGLGNDITAVASQLEKVQALIKKKKKKLLQSPKYKKKIAGYADTLDALTADVDAIQATLTKITKAKAPDPAGIAKALSITLDSTIGQLEAAASISVTKKLEDYHSLVLVLNESSNSIRSKAEFAGHMKTITKMVEDAEDMDAEGGE